MRKTKIICTIGPSCSDEETLTKMCLAGMNVARLNFSHGNHAEHLERINLIKKVRAKLNLPIAILLDTKGPEYRIGTFKNGNITLKAGDKFTFTTDKNVEGDNTIVSVSYSELHNEINPGDTILLNDGMMGFTVDEISGKNIICTVNGDGTVSDRKSMVFPGKVFKQVFLSEQDKDDIKFGIENDIDFIACSFVSCRQDLVDVKNYLAELGQPNVDIIAKIENQSGIDNIDEICEVCDGIMIARGDLGVEVPYSDLPAIQKSIITKCRLLGKRAITATEMLESMIQNPRPTRAESSDVANAVYEGTSAIMLSGETAAGKHPVAAVKAMARIAERTEASIDYTKMYYNSEFKIKNLVDAISHSACSMAIDIKAKAVSVCSLSGMTARMVSRFRPPVDILGFTTNERTYYKLAMSWGVTPVLCETYQSIDVMFYKAKDATKTALNLQPGDRIVITGGMINGTSGNTNIIKVETI